MTFLTEQQLLLDWNTNKPAFKAYASQLVTALQAAVAPIQAAEDLDSTVFVTPLQSSKIQALIKAYRDIAAVRDTYAVPILAMSHVVGSRTVPPFPELIGDPSSYTFIVNTIMGLQTL